MKSGMVELTGKYCAWDGIDMHATLLSEETTWKISCWMGGSSYSGF